MKKKLLDLDIQRRDGILNASLKEFALRGFDNASTNIIAKNAGISKPLMFHYVNSKLELFLIVYDYFTDLLEKEYFKLMDFGIRDIFNRLRQSYLLQIELLKKYPWILEFNKLSVVTNSSEVNHELDKRAGKKQSSCFQKIFDHIDESKFRAGLNIERSKQFIMWSNIGFTNQILEDIRSSEDIHLDYSNITAEIDNYLEDLRKIFYI